jgi:hypothetical protein
MNFRLFQTAATLAGATVIGTAMAIIPAAGNDLHHALKSNAKTTCNSNSPCIDGTNEGAGPAVQGVNQSVGNGIFGVADKNDGVNGTTYNPSGTLKARSGVYGVDLSTDGGTRNAGVSGGTTNGTGVLATSVNGTGMSAISSFGLSIYGYSSSSNGADIEGGYIGVIARSQAYPFVATDQNANDLFFIDNVGNVYYHGGLYQFARTKRNQEVTEYAAKQTTPTVEHVGSARLIDGVARVALDPAFADTIDGRVAYHVFVTPNGDTRGLYVTGKAADGFVVRETQQGRGTLDFDYRIVATPLGHAAEHSHIVDASLVQPHAAIAKRRPAR